MKVRTTLVRLLPIAFGLSQVQASCTYAPPPVLAQGQGGDTLGEGRVNIGAEMGFGASESWWETANVGDPDVNAGPTGVVRARVGVTENLDVGLVGGAGPDDTFVAGPEVKWRFAHLVDRASADQAAFHASLVSGVGIGSTRLVDQGNSSADGAHHPYLAPYTGVLVSGGVPLLQMFSGLRLAASQTLGTAPDVTLYPVLAFGVEVRPEPAVRVFVEGDLAAAYTVEDGSDTAILGYFTGGVSVTFGGDKPKFRIHP